MKTESQRKMTNESTNVTSGGLDHKLTTGGV